jgi:ribosome-associated protein
MAKTTPVRRPARSTRTAAGAAKTTPRRDVASRTTADAARPSRRSSAARSAARDAAPLPKGVSIAVAAAEDKKAEDLVVLDLRKAAGFTDYFVICTGANARQIVAIADAIRENLKRELDERPTVSEGLDRAEWVLLDYFDFVVHVFSRECRTFYNLERLWGNAERVAPASA